ncbi:MAG: DUF4363 family protein [Ruminococcaceae bacterium]|nr:DUF4363 family protein [Oscillospiraceae bacterium]
MKHTVISAICLVLVIAYSYSTLFYIGSVKTEIESRLIFNGNLPTASDCENIENIYESKKNVLRFILNNEFTDELEDLIVKLENAVDYSNTQDIAQYTELLKSLLDDIMYQNRCII